MKIYFLVLALIQGITEFLPLSSSGHLVLLEKILRISSQRLSLIVYLHIATLLAVVVYFWREIITALKDRKYLLHIFTAFVFTVVVVLLLKNSILYFLDNGIYLGVAFIVTAIFLILSDRVKRMNSQDLRISQVIVIGLAQGLAVLPGISRSGITIASAVLLGVNREQAFKFSFLLAIPTLIASGVYEFKNITAFLNHTGFFVVFSGFIVTFIAGLVSLHVLKTTLINKKLSPFGLYCCIIGLIILTTGGWR